MPIYSYAELKGKIKVGDRVRLGKDVCVVTRIEDNGFYLRLGDFNFCQPWDAKATLELLTEEKTLDTVDVGDVVVNDSGNEHTILDTSKSGTILFISRSNDPTGYSFALTRQQLKEYSYTVKQSTPAPKEMTLEEVGKALGYPVKIVE